MQTHEIPLMASAFQTLSLYQSQINQATVARDQVIRAIAETQLTEPLDAYDLALTISADGGKIIATPKLATPPAPQPTNEKDEPNA